MQFIVADDHPIFLSALNEALKQWFERLEIIEASSLKELERLVDDNEKPDLIILDLMIPGVRGFSALVYLRGIYPDTPIIIISGLEQESVIRAAAEYGARGYIKKTSKLPSIIEAINAVLKGEKIFPLELGQEQHGSSEFAKHEAKIQSLSARQFHVLCLLNQGLSNKQISDELSISLPTVKTHVSAILQRLDVSSRTQAVLIAKRLDVAMPAVDS